MRLVSVYEVLEAPAILYKLLSEREPHQNISHKRMPSQAEHMAFYLSRPYEHWELIVLPRREAVKDGGRDEFPGCIYATSRNELGIMLFRQYRGQGIGSKALRLFLETHKPLHATLGKRSGHWLANINPQNEASKAFFAKHGFVPLQVTLTRD